MPVTFLQDDQTTAAPVDPSGTPQPGPPSTGGNVVFTTPDPYSPLATTPPTWSEWGKHWGGLAARAAAEANPIDMGANLANLGADVAYKYLGGNQPTGGWTPPGRYASDYAVLPSPSTPAEAAFSGAVSMPVGAAIMGPASGMKFATALRQLPTQAAIGAGQGYFGYGMGPEAQLGLGLGLGAVGGELSPGMRSAQPPDVLALREAALRHDIDLPTAAVGTPGARTVYSATGVPGTRAVPTAEREFMQWADSGARSIGAAHSLDGAFTKDVFNDAMRNTITPGYTYVRSNAAAVPVATGSALDHDLMQLDNDMTHNATQPQPRVQNLIYDLIQQGQNNRRNPGSIPGNAAVTMLQGGGAIDNILRNPNSNEERRYALELKAALESATRSVMAPDVVRRWDDTDRYYTNYKTYEAAADPLTGQVTGASLAKATKDAVDNGYLPFGGGDPGLHSQIATTFQLQPRTTSAGVTPGLSWGHLWHGAGPLGGAALMEGIDLLRGGHVDPVALAEGGGLGYAAALLGHPMMRALSGGPTPPGALAYYSRLLAEPGMYVQPGEKLPYGAEQPGPGQLPTIVVRPPSQ